MDSGIQMSGFPPARRSDAKFELPDRVRRTVEQDGMLAQGDRVLVAVSGGPDSMALWRAVEVLAGPFQLVPVVAHVNYHLRGEESNADEDFCRRVAAQSGVPIFVHSCPPPEKNGRGFNLQSWARRARYAFFDRVAEAYHYPRIAVGHTYDDQVETVVGGWLSGRESFGLTGMPRSRGRIIRPLLHCRRTEVLAFLRRIGQPFRDDRSNSDRRFLRNRVRHEVLPRLRRATAPRIEDVVFRWADAAGRYLARLDGLVGQWWEGAVVNSGQEWVSFALPALRNLDCRLGFVLLRQVSSRLVGRSALPGAHVVHRFRELVTQSRAGAQLVWGGMLAEVSRHTMTFYSRRPPALPPVTVVPHGVTTAKAWGVCIRWQHHDIHGGENVRLERGAMRLIGDADIIVPPVTLRGPRAGDRLRPLGMVGHRHIADVLAEAGVPSLLRHRVPVLEDQHGVFWVVGHHQDQRIRVNAATRRRLAIEVESMPEGEDHVA